MNDDFVNWGEGILDSFNAEERLKIECTMGYLELDVDTVIPIGLIVNELLTNSLKYAFPNESSGTILISLEQAKDGLLKLSVEDNRIEKGVVSFCKGSGFGTQLIHVLTQQLDSEMYEDYLEGTSIFFQFNIKNAA